MVIVVMGVAGAGKTTVSRLLAGQLGWAFFDADDFHPKANVEKMRMGQPLTDIDRSPWLAALRVLIADCLRQRRNAVIACSALKASHRARLRVDEKQVPFVFLTGDPDLILSRLAARQSHFMPASLLQSQLALLEEPADGIRVDIALPPGEIVAKVRQALGL